MSKRLLHVVEATAFGDESAWEPLGTEAYRTEEPAAASASLQNARINPFSYRVARYVPDEEIGDAFVLIVDAGCQGGVRTEGGSWICEITNERGDMSKGYGPLAPKGARQVGAKQAVEMALAAFPRGVR